ncbi:MAG: TIGR01777 family oxidoreductase [Armatimonadetes bacterium]|nr:TIGR01777 family oxidoreductase [Armatimonadota bacterium]
MKIVIAGGSGHVGALLIRNFASRGDEVVVLSRSKGVLWDGRTLGPWAENIDGADVVINLAGRTVNCRYTAENLKQMMDSRIDSTRVIGQAIQIAKNPPRVWLQSSTATIYAHRLDAANDEVTGILGGDEPDAPFKWNASIAIAKAWETTLDQAETPHTRKVALRSAMTMSPDKGSIFDVFCSLARKGLGGTLGSGKQYVSWIHELDFANAIQFLIEREELEGAVNLASPNPLPQAEFARVLRDVVGARFGIPAPAWLVEFGTTLMRTESELVLKSRRVVPARLLQAGFEFRFPNWADAAGDLLLRAQGLIQ